MSEQLKTMLESVLQQSLQPIHHELKNINKQMEHFEEEQNELKITVQKIEKEQNELKSTVQNIQKEQSELKSTVQNIQKEQKKLANKVDNIEKEQKALTNKVDNIEMELKDFRVETNTALQVIQGGQRGFRQEMTQRFNEVNLKLSHIESDIAYTFQKTAQNELEINRIKKQ